MNFRLVFDSLRGRPTCTSFRSTYISHNARIINMGTDSNCISIGRHSYIYGDLLVFAHGGKISIGDWCFIGESTRIWSASNISIGNRVLISHNVNLFDNITHPIDPVLRHKHFLDISTKGHPKSIELKERPILIEDDVWIGTSAFIKRGVTIGQGAIVSACSVVEEDIPPMTLVSGNPARFIKSLDTRDLPYQRNV